MYKIFRRFIYFAMVFSITISVVGVSNALENSVEEQDETVNYYYDTAIFNVPGEDEKGYLEVYFGIPLKELVFEETENGYKGKYLIGVRFLDADNNEYLTDLYQNEVNLVDETETQSEKLILDQLTYKVDKKKYTLEIGVSNLEDTSISNQIVDFGILEEEGGTSISEIQLIRNVIKSDDQEDKFYKNGNIAIPNPSRMYEVPVNLVFYYEVYGLDKSKSETPVRYIIAQINGRIIKDIEKILKVEGKDRVVIDVVKLDDIQGGFYNLFIEFPEEEIARRKEFIVYEEERLEEFQALYFQLKLQPYTDEEAAKIGEELSIISSEQQMELYYKLDNSLKPYYVYKFWKGLDPDATTEENEFKDEFYQRLEYVKDKYTISNKKGWNTDMGRVYMKYGPPDEITSEPTGISSMIGIDTSTFETQPTEAWVYDQVGYSGREMVFIFVDFGTDGIYNIFSSTEPGYGRLLE